MPAFLLVEASYSISIELCFPLPFCDLQVTFENSLQHQRLPDIWDILTKSANLEQTGFGAFSTMRMSVEHERLVRMIRESISLMCKSSLNYELELNVEGLLGITLDKKDIFLVNINESFQTDAQKEILDREKEEAELAKTPKKRHHDSDTDIKEEEGSAHSPLSGAKRRRARRRSRDSQGMAETESSASTSQQSPAHRPHAEISRDSVHLGGSVESQSSGDTGVKEESSGLDFGDFVIKQEVGDVDENVEGGDEDDDLYFTGESFEEQPPYQMGMPGPSGAGGGLEQVPVTCKQTTDS